MKGFTSHAGIAAPLLRDNIDTDQIIPSREMKTVSKDGLGEGLFAGQRYIKAGSRDPNPDFILNKPEYAKATILVSGKNFGCGSSREHAVWALTEFGIRAIVAESFGEIFFNNCVRNGILPIQLPMSDIKVITQSPKLMVDLPNQTISSAGHDYGFDISSANKDMIMNGLDPIDLTLAHKSEIDTFLESDKTARPWVY